MFKALGTQFVFLAIVILTASSGASSAPLKEDGDPSSFLERSIEITHASIQFAEVAMSKAEGERVKHFAKNIAGYQKQALQTLGGLRQNNLVRDIAYTGVDRNVLTAEHREALERLSLLSGLDFDRNFIDTIVYEFRRAIRLFEQEAGISTMHQNKLRRTAPPAPGEIADLARDLLPFLRQQLSEAESIQREFRY